MIIIFILVMVSMYFLGNFFKDSPNRDLLSTLIPAIGGFVIAIFSYLRRK